MCRTNVKLSVDRDNALSLRKRNGNKTIVDEELFEHRQNGGGNIHRSLRSFLYDAGTLNGFAASVLLGDAK
jgi:hypothetical protein